MPEILRIGRILAIPLSRMNPQTLYKAAQTAEDLVLPNNIPNTPLGAIQELYERYAGNTTPPQRTLIHTECTGTMGSKGVLI